MEIISPGAVSAWLLQRKKLFGLRYVTRAGCIWIKVMPSRCMADSSFQNVAAVKKY